MLIAQRSQLPTGNWQLATGNWQLKIVNHQIFNRQLSLVSLPRYAGHAERCGHDRQDEHG